MKSDDDNYEEMNSYLNAIWLVIITVTTVGYGDYSACTLPGRILTVLIALNGTLLMAIIVGVVFKEFQLDSTRKMAVTHHQVTIEARNVIVRSIKYFMAKKRHASLYKDRNTKFITLLKAASPEGKDPFESSIPDISIKTMKFTNQSSDEDSDDGYKKETARSHSKKCHDSKFKE